MKFLIYKTYYWTSLWWRWCNKWCKGFKIIFICLYNNSAWREIL